jgi:hypothetical protein
LPSSTRTPPFPTAAPPTTTRARLLSPDSSPFLKTRPFHLGAGALSVGKKTTGQDPAHARANNIHSVATIRTRKNGVRIVVVKCLLSPSQEAPTPAWRSPGACGRCAPPSPHWR